jgi:hypothetical protein
MNRFARSTRKRAVDRQAAPPSGRNGSVRQAQAIFASFQHARRLALALLCRSSLWTAEQPLFFSLQAAYRSLLAGRLSRGGHCVFIFRQSQRAANAHAIPRCSVIERQGRRLKQQLRQLQVFDRNEEETASPAAVPRFQPRCKRAFSAAGFQAPVRRYWPRSGSWVIAQ